MYEVNCETCGKELFIGKISESSYEYWCPFCFGLKPLERNEAIKVCENYISEVREKALTSAQTFSKSALLFAALAAREIAARKIKNMYYNRVQPIFWASFIIRDCINGNYSNSSPKKPTEENLSVLFSYYASIIESENLFVQVKEEYFHLFEGNSIIEKLDFGPGSVEIGGKFYKAFPAQQWRYYLEMMQTFQMCTDGRFDISMNRVNTKVENYLKEKKEIKLKINRAGKKVKIKLGKELSSIEKSFKAETFEIIYNSFHSVYYNKYFFSFEDISKNEKIIDFIDQIIAESANEIEHLSRQPGNEQILYEIEINKFKNLCELEGLDFTEIRRILISSEDNFKEFPLLVEYENKILFCPETLRFILSFIKYDTDKKSYKSDSSLLGDYFEEEVKVIFESHGFSFRHPIHKNQKMIRQKIEFEKEGELVKREIDLISYDDNLLFIVECKRYSFKPGYIYKSERQNRVSVNGGIKDEIDIKHRDRVTYFQNNQRDFGFKEHKEVKGLIITLIKEDIERYQ
jgi:hypothetical protein